MRLIRSCGVLSLSFAGLVAGAQNLQPGLWEFTTQMSGESGSKMNAAMENMQKQMAAMSPEQRKMMQDMMAKQGMQMGSAGGSAGGGGITLKVCMTQEVLDRNEMVSGQRGECKNTWSPRTGNTMKYAFSCTKPPSSGEGEVTFVSPTAYTNRMSLTHTMQGKTEKTEINGSGKWLGKDCGAIKPLAASSQAHKH